MTMKHIPFPIVCVLFLFFPAVASLAVENTGQGEGTGKIEARLLLPGKGGGAQGAVLHAYHIDTEKTIVSAPAGRKGTVVLENIPYGYYDLAVELNGEFFVASQVVVVPPSGRVVVTMKLEPYNATTGKNARTFQGRSEPAQGVARLNRKAVGREFWRSPKGIAIVTGGSGAALLAIASGSGNRAVSNTFP